MKFTILLNSEDESTTPLMVSQIERTGPLQAVTLGLTLAESKRILAKNSSKHSSNVMCKKNGSVRSAEANGGSRIIIQFASRACLAE